MVALMNQDIRIDLTAALLRELSDTWREINANHFHGRMRPPVLALSDVGRRLGQWNSSTRTISVDRALVFEQPWSVVREVLKHEIAHQFVDEILQARDQAAHGPAFDDVCRRFGIDARATGMPAAPTGGEGGSPVLRRISRLLALAESPNVHEAEAAMKTAQRLMLKHNIDATVAAASDGYTFVHLGIPRRRVEAAEHVLAGLLARHFLSRPSGCSPRTWPARRAAAACSNCAASCRIWKSRRTRTDSCSKPASGCGASTSAATASTATRSGGVSWSAR